MQAENNQSEKDPQFWRWKSNLKYHFTFHHKPLHFSQDLLPKMTYLYFSWNKNPPFFISAFIYTFLLKYFYFYKDAI